MKITTEIPVQQDIIVDVIESHLEVAYANQYDDNTSTIHCHIQKRGVDFNIENYTVTLRVKKSNGKGFSANIGSEELEGIVHDNVVSFKIPRYLTVSHGKQICNLEFFEKDHIENGIKYSCTFYLRVNKSALQEEDILDSDYYASVHDEYVKLKTDMTDALTQEQERATQAENTISDNLAAHLDDKDNPHNVTKTQLGLGSVEDKSSAAIREEITKANVTDALGYTPYTPNEVDDKLSALESNKVDKIDGKGLSTNDFTNDYKTTLDNISGGTVTGIKGNTESSYRTGNVNITPGNIGALATSGGAMTGNIAYKGTKQTYDVIKFIDNVSDIYGNGISLGGGGAVVIGGGESQDAMTGTLNSGGDEKLMLGNDQGIDFYTNCQNGMGSAKHITMNTDGSITAAGFNGRATSATSADYATRGGRLDLPRVKKNVSYKPGNGRMVVEEFDNSSENLPTAAWYHVFTGEGADTNYTTQLALGMTTNRMFYRANQGSYASWLEVITSGSHCISKDAAGAYIPSGWLHTFYGRDSGPNIGAPYTNELDFTFGNSSNGWSGYTSHGIKLTQGASSSSFSTLMPRSNGACYLGNSSTKWNQVYSINSSISTSDKNEKHEISYIGESSDYDTSMSDKQVEQMIMGLKPCVFKRNNGESGRPHHGIIAQDFESLLKKINLSDHAAFIKAPKTKDVEVATGKVDKNGKPTYTLEQEIIEDEYHYGLRYEELISDIIRFAQLQKLRADSLEEKLTKQEKEITEIKNILANNNY